MRGRFVLVSVVLAGSALSEVTLAQDVASVDADPIEPTRSVLDRPARLEVRNVTLGTALTELSERSGVQVAFSPSRLGRVSGVSCACGKVTVAQALDWLLSSTDYHYTEVEGHVVVLSAGEGDISPELERLHYARPLYALAASRSMPSVESRWAEAAAPIAYRQERTITGRVTDQTSGAPVVSANVSVDGTNAGTFTDDAGAFVLDVPAGEVIIRISSIGYVTRDVTVAASASRVDVALETDVLGLEEIVVTGQATGIQRRNLANSVATVGAAELGKAPAASVEQMLAGKLAGALIQQNSGAPGGGSRIRLRGITSIIGPGEPLYVVDGVIVSNARVEGGMNAVSLAQGSNNIASPEQMNPINRIADLNPASIERVEVLKGASASAIYGSKASNGVILITTKRGQVGAPRFRVKQGFGIASRAFTFGSRYFETLEDAVDAFGPQAADHWSPGYGAVSLEEQISGREPLQFETSASVSGGTEATRYYAAALVRHEPGIVLNTFADKASLRLNLDQTIGDQLSISTGTAVIRTAADRGMFGNDNAGTSYYFVLPHHPNFFDLRATCPDSTRQVSCEGGIYPDNPYVASNPLQSATQMTRDETVWRFLGSGRVTFEAVRSDQHELRLMLNGGFDQFTHKYNLISPPELQFEDDDGLPGTRVLSFGHSLNTNINANLVHVYRSPDAGLSATTSLGMQLEREDLTLDRTATRGLVGGTPNVAAGSAVLVEEENVEVKDLGFFAQEELLLFDERLLLTVGARADRSSNNADTDKVHFYPKAAASYRLPFGGLVEELKLRAAFGQSGNRPLFGQKYSNLSTTNIASVTGLRVAPQAGAVDARPERQTELEGGFDVQLFQGRALWEFTGYHKTIEDLLLQRTLAPSSGFTSEVFNGGKLRVWGLETVLNVTPFESANTTWNATLNWSMNRSKVLDLPVPAFIARGFYSQGAIVIEEGKSATQWVANDTLPGAANFADPQVVVEAQGDAEPQWTAGLTSSVQYKGLNVSATIDAVKGGLVNLGTWRHWDAQQNAYDHDAIDSETGVPLGEQRRKWSALAPRTYTRDASYIKLRELNLSFELPTSITQRIWRGIQSAQLTLSARNLLTNQSLLGGDFYRGSDPEVANYNSGTHFANNVMWTREFAAYPSSRSFWFSVTLNF